MTGVTYAFSRSLDGAPVHTLSFDAGAEVIITAKVYVYPDRLLIGLFRHQGPEAQSCAVIVSTTDYRELVAEATAATEPSIRSLLATTEQGAGNMVWVTLPATPDRELMVVLADDRWRSGAGYQGAGLTPELLTALSQQGRLTVSAAE